MPKTTTTTTTRTTKTTTRRPKNTVTHVVFVIDQSGSMSPRANDVRGGFNEYIAALKLDDSIRYLLSATVFADAAEILFDTLALDDVPELTIANYRPSGSTALYDAIGVSLDAITTTVKTKKKPYGTAKVIFVVMTDGEENASRSFSREQIVGKIKRREAAGNWTFAYLGADQDAWAHSEMLGFGQGNTLSYNSHNTRGVYAALASTTSATAHSSIASSTTFGQDLQIDLSQNAAPNQTVGSFAFNTTGTMTRP